MKSSPFEDDKMRNREMENEEVVTATVNEFKERNEIC